MTTINQAVIVHKSGDLYEAERLYKKILETDPNHIYANNNIGVLLLGLGRFDEAIKYFKKAIELNPDYPEAHNNLGATLLNLKKFEEAKIHNKKAIELKPDYPESYFNLGNSSKELGKFDEAIKYFKKAIELKPDYPEAHNNLSVILYTHRNYDKAEIGFRNVIKLNPKSAEAFNNLGNSLKEQGKFDEAIIYYKKAIELKQDYLEAHYNLDLILTLKKLLLKLEQVKNFSRKTTFNFFKKLPLSNLRLNSNPFISNREVEAELIGQLYKIKSKKLDDVDETYLRYGNGRSSDYKLFDNNFSILKIVEKDLINIMQKAVQSEIFILESFFNIFQKGSGIVFHNHISNFDKIFGLIKKKFSLTYYLDVGDQNCKEPGILKFKDPENEILPTNGMVMIFPSDRKHSATYDGEKDRIMIGINFYSLI